MIRVRLEWANNNGILHVLGRLPIILIASALPLSMAPPSQRSEWPRSGYKTVSHAQQRVLEGRRASEQRQELLWAHCAKPANAAASGAAAHDQGIMRLSIVISNLEVVPIPGDKITDPERDRR